MIMITMMMNDDIIDSSLGLQGRSSGTDEDGRLRACGDSSVVAVVAVVVESRR